MAKDTVQEIDNETVPSLPDSETDDLGASMINEDDAAVEERLEAEDEEFKGEMKSEPEAEAEEDTE